MVPFISTAADVENIDRREGSRTIYVEKEDEFFLTVMLRKCTCENPSSLHECRLCSCFEDFRKSDQPFVQGSPSNVITALLNKFGKNLPGFSYGEDETGKFFFRLPRPERLLEILQTLNLDCIELVSGTVPLGIEEYLGLLGKKKIPLSEIPAPHEVDDISMRYHAYFHDLFNHFIFWIALPLQIKELIATRANLFIERFGELAKQFISEDEKDCTSFIRVLMFVAALRFDASMGTSNNYLLNSLHPFSYDSKDENAKKKAQKRYLRFINFGIKPLGSEKMLKSNAFLSLWLYSLGLSYQKGFTALSQNKLGEANFDIFNAIQKDTVTLDTFKYIKSLPQDRVKSIFSRVRTKYDALFGALTDTEEEIILPKLEDLYQEITSFYETLLKNEN